MQNLGTAEVIMPCKSVHHCHWNAFRPHFGI